MSTPSLVQDFYERIWNAGDYAAADILISDDFCFRGSLGAEMRGREAFLEYVRFVRTALADYRCEILECVAEGSRAFAQMRFSGLHVGTFRGCPPTGQPINWIGAALFRFDGQRIVDLWVLGDLVGLDALLKSSP